MLDQFLSFKGAAKKVNKKIVEYSLFVTAHNRSGFESYVVFKNLPQWRTNVDSIKNGATIVSLKIFNGSVDKKKKKSSICPFQMWESS